MFRAAFLGALLALSAGVSASPGASPLNAQGFPLLGETGNPLNYGPATLKKPFVQPSLEQAAETDNPAMTLTAKATIAGTSNTRSMWAYSVFGSSIGASNIVVANNQGTTEIIVAGTISGDFGANNFWHSLAVDPQTGNPQQTYTSPRYSSAIRRIDQADVNNDGKKEIVVGLENGAVFL